MFGISLPPHLEWAFPSALERIKQAEAVLGIVWAGSSARGQADEHSDLDFYVLVAGNVRHRVSFMAGGAPIEAIYNPAQQIGKEIVQGDASTLSMLTERRVVLEHPELSALIAEARQKLKGGRPAKPLSDFQSHVAVDAVWEAKSATGQSIHSYKVMEAVNLLLNAFYHQRGWWDVKPKHWLSDLDQRDLKSAGLLLALLKTHETKWQPALEALALHVLGGLAWSESSTEPEQI